MIGGQLVFGNVTDSVLTSDVAIASQISLNCPSAFVRLILK